MCRVVKVDSGVENDVVKNGLTKAASRFSASTPPHLSFGPRRV